MGSFGQVYGTAAITALVAIVVAWLNGRANRDTKKIDASVATAQLQTTAWAALLEQKDKTIAQQEARITAKDTAIAQLEEMVEERDAIIASFLARLGPALEPDDMRETADEQPAG